MYFVLILTAPENTEVYTLTLQLNGYTDRKRKQKILLQKDQKSWLIWYKTKSSVIRSVPVSAAITVKGNTNGLFMDGVPWKRHVFVELKVVASHMT